MKLKPLILIPLGLFVLVSVALIIVIVAAVIMSMYSDSPRSSGRMKPGDSLPININHEIEQFTSADDFLNYMETSSAGYGYGLTTAALPARTIDDIDQVGIQEFSTADSPSVDRVSTTNVQVVGIDEPDIVKTDGETLFISELFTQNAGVVEERFGIADDFYPGFYGSNEVTKVVNALPVSNLAIQAEIDASGDLLLEGDYLIVIGYEAISAYDISDPSQPEEAWRTEFGSNSQYHSARMYNGELFLITNDYIQYGSPCPYAVLEGDITLSVACTDIWHPTVPTTADTTFTAARINPATGDVKDTLSFVGSAGQSTVYMSGEHLYVSYVVPPDPIETLYQFATTEGSQFFDSAMIERIEEIRSYDISSQSKQNELDVVLNDLSGSITEPDMRREFENNFSNAGKAFFEQNKRSFEHTGIMKIGLGGNMAIVSTGQVPGVPLNQFSFDEYNDHLRVATTVGEPNWQYGWLGFGSRDDSVNDLYVLNDELDVVGTVQDLGAGERIYSTRFIGDKGYMVTFREIDPFYVFDLSDPASPQQTGELKIPGFSSYLHPVTDDLILGVGEEDNQVKLSLFDVSDERNPEEVSKYILDEYWSEAVNNPHAFLQDPETEMVFIPGSQDGYIFSYANAELRLEKAVSRIQARRAVYINQYLYVIGRSQLVVLDQSTWERVAEIELDSN